MKKHRVVITGVGLVTPVGLDRLQCWDSIVSGRSGISTFNTNIDLGYPSKVAGQVGDISKKISEIISSTEQKKMSRFIHLALIAAHEAINSSDLKRDLPLDRERFGAYVGVGVGGLADIESAAIKFSQDGYRSVSPFLIPKLISNEAPAWMSIKYNLKGPTMAITNACSSGNDAVGQAFRMIKDGYADYMLAGGAESCLTPLGMVGFGNMRALSSWDGDPAKASRPFDKDRSGFVIAEGAGMVLLEREDLARSRGAEIYSEIVGYGSSSDAHHITAIHPEGHGAISAINDAMKQAGINKESIGYINAHGTATYMNDPAETKILKTVFGEKPSLMVSSTKSMTGHMLGAAGGVEAAFTALAIKNKILPPTINLDTPDKGCDLDYIPNHARDKEVEYAMSNSFGFGGANSVILLKRY